jgi:hypothetical protein
VKSRQLAIGLIALPLLVTGCGSAQTRSTSARVGAGSTGATMAPGQTMAPGMTMAPGQTMAAMTNSAGAASSAAFSHPVGEPSAAAKMVCSDDIRGQVRKVLKLARPAPIRTSWQDRLYTCTYTLPMGPMVLSVQQSATKAAARQYFQALRSQLGRTTPLIGLGEQAYASTTGYAVVLKDNMTLRVDTTRLPEVFGDQDQHRTDLAAEIASDVMGCWTGGDS